MGMEGRLARESERAAASIPRFSVGRPRMGEPERGLGTGLVPGLRP